jgi:hypothetical protein
MFVDELIDFNSSEPRVSRAESVRTSRRYERTPPIECAVACFATLSKYAESTQLLRTRYSMVDWS